MEPKRTLHSGNLVRGFHVGDAEVAKRRAFRF